MIMKGYWFLCEIPKEKKEEKLTTKFDLSTYNINNCYIIR